MSYQQTPAELYLDVYGEMQTYIMYDALSYRKGKSFTWTKVKPLQIKLVWQSFVRMGIVLNPKLVDKIQQTFLENIAILDVLTGCMGHAQYCGIQEMVDLYELNLYQKRKLRKVFWDTDYHNFSNGQPLLSDYGLPQLKTFLEKALSETAYEKKIVWLDAILNVVHPRSDLAELFVEGGSESLTEIAELKNL